MEADAKTAEGWWRHMKKEDFKPGQTVYLLPTRFAKFPYLRIEKQIIESMVQSVGRKYITRETHDFRMIRFDIDNDFREVTPYTANYKLYLSKEDIANDLRRRELEERVETAFHFPNHVTKKMTFEELQTVNNIVKKYMRF